MNFVSRVQWGARQPAGPIPPIDSIVSTGHWEGTPIWHGTIGPHTSCAPMVRGIQAYHMDANGWLDIAYNGVACPHGYVFEGRGPQRRSAANGTNTANAQSAVICYLGGVGDPFTLEGRQAMVDGAAWLGDTMRKGHRDWYATACPGPDVYSWIQAGTPLPQPPAPQPPPPTTQETTVLHLIIGPAHPEWWVTDWITKRWVRSPDEAAALIFSTIKTGGRIETNGNNGPVVYEQVFVDSIPTLTI